MQKVFGYLIISLFLLPTYAQQNIDASVSSKYYYDGVQLFSEGAYRASALLLEKYLQEDKEKSLRDRSFFLFGS